MSPRNLDRFAQIHSMPSDTLVTQIATTVYIWSYMYFSHNVPVSQIKTICRARNLWELAQYCEQLRLLCPQTLEISQALLYSVHVKAP